MALYTSNSYGRGGNWRRRWIPIISVIVVGALAIVFVFGYNPFSKKQADQDIKPPEVVQEKVKTEEPPPPKPKKVEPKIEPKPVPVLPKPVPQVNVPQVEITKNVVPEPSSQATILINEAMGLLALKPAKIIEARDKLNKGLSLPMQPKQRAFVKTKLSELADKWLFSREVFPNDKLCSNYKVKSGDLLSNIGKAYKVPYQILQRVNNIPRPELLKLGETIKVINGPFNARVFRSTFTMDLYLKNTFVKSFPVGLGKPGHETPTGLWIVKSGGKLERPPWTDPDTHRRYQPDDPDYPLGSRWVGLEGVKGAAKDREGFAIHGTKDPQEIGAATSRGCIRLHNGDAILVYDVLVPVASQVEVVD